MTVAELIEELRKWPPEATVQAEGCDCINPVSGVGSIEYGDIVLIEVET